MFTTTKYIHDACFDKINITEIKENWFSIRRELDKIQTLEAELEELYDEISLKRKSSSSSDSSSSEDEAENEKKNQHEQLKAKIKKQKGNSFNLKEAVACNFLPNAASDVMEGNIVVGFDKPAIYSSESPLIFQVVKIRAVYIVTSVEQNNHYLPVTLANSIYSYFEYGFWAVVTVEAEKIRNEREVTGKDRLVFPLVLR
jgi:hypothetical protein